MRESRGRIFAAAVLAMAVVQLAGCMPGSRPGSTESPIAAAEPAKNPVAAPRANTATAPLKASAQPVLTQTIETVTTVGPHDNLYTVARAHNVPIRDLIQWNGLDPPFDLKPGQVLRLPPKREHVVAQGETLYSISRRYGADMTVLARLNGIEPPYTIAVGRRLQLPAPSVVAAAGAPPVAPNTPPTPAPAAAASAITPAAPPAPVPAGSAPAANGTQPTVEAVALPPLPSSQDAATAKLAPAVSAPTSANAGTVRSSAPAAAAAPDVAAEPKPAVQTAALPDVAPAAKPAIQTAALPEIVPEPKPDLAIVPPAGGQAFIWPIRGKVISPYGEKKGGEHNDGINIEARRGEPVKAAADGTVIYAGNELRGFGNLVLIKHADGWTTAYAHNDTLLVARGAQVKRGQVIAKAGSTGSVSVPQLHFELRRGTRAVNPADYLTATAEAATPISRASARAAPPDLE